MRKLALVALLASGCGVYFHPLTPNQNGDRVWLVNGDGTKLYRCMDLTPSTTPYRGGMRVLCKEAEWYDATHAPMAEQVQEPSSITSPPK